LDHCNDILSTIQEIAGNDESAVPGLDARRVSSRSIVPILKGTDTTDRIVIAERSANNPGRAIIPDDYPDYKLIIFGNPDSNSDTPSIEFYNTGAPSNDINEQNPLSIGGLSGTALDAYNACIAKDAEVGGGYNSL
ncbi:MAG: hypothetical protein F7O42_02520, partial [Opitutae bacterium]|nr:hypothetical protein [Opitutae bacterium]